MQDDSFCGFVVVGCVVVVVVLRARDGKSAVTYTS
jgi:hypothetical protein